MQYVFAMIGAIVVALLATLFVSPYLASWVVGLFTFDSPDEVGNLEDAVFMLSNLAGLMIGWTIGWFGGGRFLAGRQSSAG